MQIRRKIESEEELMNIISWFLKERRASLGITQQVLCDLTNTFPSWLSRLENGSKKEISLWMFYKIVSALNGTINFTFDIPDARETDPDTFKVLQKIRQELKDDESKQHLVEMIDNL